ncbi:DotU family type VI secretion system protein [Pseudomonas phytophila]|uniref:DotU family type VI secretion system protein n=1 Tax=Pseudomonas phytophila TaxID=2867264 RepID=A0ABY6FFY0_9PSED|nr:DotU family type VI secretion system protein [Pseudomonas phytophila]UXZ96528.1 DotU family type VI secretion system protein [Pseudomonas phytophila]
MTRNDDPSNPFESPNDRTQFMPRPGGRGPQPVNPEQPTAPPAAPAGPALTGKAQGLNPLESAAGPLLALLTRLRSTIAHPAPASLRAQLLGYLRQFEQDAEAAGIARNEVLLARYALCTALDEAVLSTPWGSTSEWGKQSLLITVHNEAWGGEKVFQLLEHCLQSPRERLYLLELLYLCMCLGFEGRYRVMNDGRSQLDALRERTSAAIRSARGEYERELSPHWRGLSVARDRLSQFMPPWVGVAIGLALLLLLLFGLRLKLASDAEPVFKNIHALGEIPVQAIDRPVVQPKLVERPRLAGFLADEIKAGRVSVEDAVDRSVVTIRGDELFASASASIVDDFQPLMLRIADAIRNVKGQVRVTGHSDNRPIATLRFPSNWALSQARAEQVLQILAAKTGQPQRFTAEGRSDTEPLAPNNTSEGRAKNRRVEITVLAEGVE